MSAENLSVTSSGLEMLNALRHRFAEHMNNEIDQIINTRVTNAEQAHALSRHLTHRLTMMRMLNVLTDAEMNTAAQQIMNIVSGQSKDGLYFPDVKESQYEDWLAMEMITMWRESIQQVFTNSIEIANSSEDENDRTRLLAFAENAMMCCWAIGLLMDVERDNAMQIVASARTVKTTIDTQFIANSKKEV